MEGLHWLSLDWHENPSAELSPVTVKGRKHLTQEAEQGQMEKQTLGDKLRRAVHASHMSATFWALSVALSILSHLTPRASEADATISIFIDEEPSA